MQTIIRIATDIAFKIVNYLGTSTYTTMSLRHTLIPILHNYRFVSSTRNRLCKLTNRMLFNLLHISFVVQYI